MTVILLVLYLQMHMHYDGSKGCLLLTTAQIMKRLTYVSECEDISPSSSFFARKTSQSSHVHHI